MVGTKDIVKETEGKGLIASVRIRDVTYETRGRESPALAGTKDAEEDQEGRGLTVSVSNVICHGEEKQVTQRMDEGRLYSKV